MGLYSGSGPSSTIIQLPIQPGDTIPYTQPSPRKGRCPPDTVGRMTAVKEAFPRAGLPLPY